MAIDRTPTDEVPYFESPREVTLEEDRVELDIHLIGWSKKMRIRALSFAQMEQINKLATDKETGKIDQAEWVYRTIKEGVTRPMFTYNQAKDLADNNGEFVRELADEIWNLGRISKRMWDAYILEQKRLAAIEKTGNPDAGNEETDSSE